ncbi:MAG TPA: urease accessory protein UreF [Rhodopila sp.]
MTGDAARAIDREAAPATDGEATPGINSAASRGIDGKASHGVSTAPLPQALLRLMAWLSPAFPTGGFAYSHGLEWAVESGDVTNETTLRAWLGDVLAFGTGRADTILLRHAHRAGRATVARQPTPATATADHFDSETVTLKDIADLACATASGRERQNESLDQGRAFMLAAAAWGVPQAPERIPYPVAVGAVAGAHDIPEDATAAAYLQAFATNLISAAVRLVPLGQSAGLRVLASLESTILATANETKPGRLDDLGGCAFRSDLAAMRHETQYTRLFRS